ncbi:hypothetical protein SCAR479_05925 [Seiridium cardinale]|uniref:Uncharacterized protein n=1 Tax=Seiridium cardinale TaxID=138064 RepID=A0ABR2XV01_9PEZI
MAGLPEEAIQVWRSGAKPGDYAAPSSRLPRDGEIWTASGRCVFPVCPGRPTTEAFAHWVLAASRAPALHGAPTNVARPGAASTAKSVFFSNYPAALIVDSWGRPRVDPPPRPERGPCLLACLPAYTLTFTAAQRLGICQEALQRTQDTCLHALQKAAADGV